MAKINSIIPQKNYELIRDRIASILNTEIANQYVLTNLPALNALVYIERSIAFHKEEIPAVNVTVLRGDYSNKHTGQKDGTYVFAIDTYHKAKTKKVGSTITRGDYSAAANLHKLMGVIDAILENSDYKTLDFTPGIIAGTRVMNINVGPEQTDGDGFNTCRGRMEFEVRCIETTALKEGDLIAGNDTKVKLYETETGYVYAMPA